MRVNQISDQDEITLPGLNHGDTIRYGVEVDASAITDVANRKSDKKKEEASAFKLSPAMMIGGGVYLAILIGAGLFHRDTGRLFHRMASGAAEPMG